MAGSQKDPNRAHVLSMKEQEAGIIYNTYLGEKVYGTDEDASCHIKDTLEKSVYNTHVAEAAYGVAPLTPDNEKWEEQNKDYLEYGLGRSYDGHRWAMLRAYHMMGQEGAEVAIYTSCALYGMPTQAVALARIFERMNVPYTTSKEVEYCCAWPMVERTKSPEARHKSFAASKAIMDRNNVVFQELGIKKVATLCNWCAHLGKYHYDGTDVEWTHIIDLVLPQLKQTPLEIKGDHKRRIAYYNGCQIRNKLVVPGVSLRWDEYMELMYQVKGVDIFELNHRTC